MVWHSDLICLTLTSSRRICYYREKENWEGPVEVSLEAQEISFRVIFFHQKCINLAVSGVQVEGTVTARVTQTCVRTGEKFDVDVEFPLFAIVRPLPTLLKRGEEAEEIERYMKNDRSSTPTEEKETKYPGP